MIVLEMLEKLHNILRNVRDKFHNIFRDVRRTVMIVLEMSEELS